MLQRRVPSTNPVRADTKLAEAASNPFGGGGFPLAGCAEAVLAPSATSTAGSAASTTARPNDTLINESPNLRALQVVLQPAYSYDAPDRPLVGPDFMVSVVLCRQAAGAGGVSLPGPGAALAGQAALK
jgi:hypothetical protein